MSRNRRAHADTICGDWYLVRRRRQPPRPIGSSLRRVPDPSLVKEGNRGWPGRSLNVLVKLVKLIFLTYTLQLCMLGSRTRLAPYVYRAGLWREEVLSNEILMRKKNSNREVPALESNFSVAQHRARDRKLAPRRQGGDWIRDSRNSEGVNGYSRWYTEKINK